MSKQQRAAEQGSYSDLRLSRSLLSSGFDDGPLDLAWLDDLNGSLSDTTIMPETDSRQLWATIDGDGATRSTDSPSLRERMLLTRSALMDVNKNAISRALSPGQGYGSDNRSIGYARSSDLSIEYIDYAADAIDLSQKGLYAFGTKPAMEITGRAASLLRDQRLGIAYAEDFKEAAAVSKSNDGKSAISLTKADLKYGYALKSLAVVGQIIDIPEEYSYLQKAFDQGKGLEAAFAWDVNIIGDAAVTLAGNFVGGIFGIATPVFGPSSPVLGAAAFGYSASKWYDTNIKENVRVFFTDIPTNADLKERK